MDLDIRLCHGNGGEYMEVYSKTEKWDDYQKIGI